MQETELWRAVLGEIELSISHGNFVTWFKATKLLSYDSEVLVIGVTNLFIKSQLEKKYGQLLRKTLSKNGVDVKTISYKILSGAPRQPVEESILVMPTASKPAAEPIGSRPPTTGTERSHAYRRGLNERYTFDNFVVGSGNELAFAACQAAATYPGTKYNPLFLYGGVGIGKTHLIQAVGNAIVIKHPSSKVLYVSSEQFVRELVEAIRFKKTHDFASHYRGTDVLIVDDVQFIAGKEKMQEEFFHTFNALHQANKQIILTSDRPPRDIPTLEDRLRSRFGGGMTIDMQIPDFETRCAIIQTKAGTQGFELEPEIVDYLSNYQTNIRELEASLNRVLAWCEMRGIEPTMAITTSLLGSQKTRPKHLSAKQIIERTARHFQVQVEDITGPKRDKDIVVPRQIAMYILRSELHLSFPKIARELGRKDHTTAMHSVDKIETELRVDSDLRTAVDEIKERLYA